MADRSEDAGGRYLYPPFIAQRRLRVAGFTGVLSSAVDVWMVYWAVERGKKKGKRARGRERERKRERASLARHHPPQSVWPPTVRGEKVLLCEWRERRRRGRKQTLPTFISDEEDALTSSSRGSEASNRRHLADEHRRQTHAVSDDAVFFLFFF